MSAPRTLSVDNSAIAPANDVIHNGEAWASAAEPDPWAPALLTLDGGGIRGYSSLLILKALMHEIAIWEQRLAREDATREAAALTDTATDTQPDDAVPVDGGAIPLVENEIIGGITPQRPALDEIGNEPDLDTNLGPADALEPPAEPLNIPAGTTAEENGVSAPEGTSDFEDNLLPCHYFDYMYGTSTGGLIATMLGRLRMSVPQCLKIYREVSDGLFGKQRSRVPLTTKYYHKPLEIAVKGIVRQYCKQHTHTGPDACDGLDWHPWGLEIPQTSGADFDNHICQSICLTAIHNGKIDEAHLLRTYNQEYFDVPNWVTTYNEGADKLRIWQVTRATTAAPFYFKALQADIKGERWSFKDGGIRENNPAGAAWSEYVSMYGEGVDPVLLLSIGTGKPNADKDGFAAAWPGPLGNSTMIKKATEKFAVLKNVLVKYTAGEEKHRAMLDTARGEHKWYKRLNVSTGLASMPLDSWKRGSWTDPATGETSDVVGGETLTQIERVTKEYLARDIDQTSDTYAPPKTMLVQVAEKLVRQRRAREATAADDQRRWDTYMGKYLTGVYVNKMDGPLETVEVPVEGRTPVLASILPGLN